jgi:hypothetical protein
MAKKKTKKKIVKKKLTEEEQEELVAEGELPKKAVRKSEDRQLAWFVGIVIFIFIVTLGSYYWVESAKTFEFGGVEWAYEEDVDYYHGRFMNLLGEDYTYNIFLRNDPRKNDVPTEGAFDKFKYGVVISTSPEFDSCRGDASRVMRDLGAFMREGFGAGPTESGSTDEDVANASERRFATCDNIDDRTVLIIDRGDNFVDQDDDNLDCYTIYIEDCDDASPVEKFMLKVIKDFGSV